MASACVHVPVRAVRLRADALARRLARLDANHWAKVIALVPPAGAPRAVREEAPPRCSSAAELSALARSVARLRTPVLGVLGSQGALPIATLASLGAGGVCLALEDAALAVTAPAHGLPLALGESALLARLPARGLGAYLAMTGSVLGTHELVHAGLARDYLHSRTFARLREALSAVDDLDALGGLDVPPATATVNVGADARAPPAPPPAQLRREQRARAGALALHCAVYGQAHEVSAPEALLGRLAEIARLFHLDGAAHDSPVTAVGEVAKRLANRPSEWSVHALRAMAAASPLGLQLASRQLRAAAAAPSLGDCLRAEARAHAAFEAHCPEGAARADECERAATYGFGLEPWHEPFGAFAALDAPEPLRAREPEGSPDALAARICDSAREASAVLDGWRSAAR